MYELPLTYVKELASQIIFISVFLGGFSAAILGTLIVSNNNSKVIKIMILGSSISAVSFIVTVMSMTQVFMMTLPGYPEEVSFESTSLYRIIGFFIFLVGIISLLFVISVSGWVKSRKLGIATTVVGVLGLLLTFFSMLNIS